MLSVLEYLDRAGSSPFAGWFQTLDAAAAAKVTSAVRRLELGNFSNVKGVGAGVFCQTGAGCIDFDAFFRLLDTDVGARQVEDILGRIEHGVIS